jgi:hypothetical protein
VLRWRHPPLWKVNPINARQIRQNLTYLRRFTPCHVGTCSGYAFSGCNQVIDRHLAWHLGACTTCKIPPDRGSYFKHAFLLPYSPLAQRTGSFRHDRTFRQ